MKKKLPQRKGGKMGQLPSNPKVKKSLPERFPKTLEERYEIKG